MWQGLQWHQRPPCIWHLSPACSAKSWPANPSRVALVQDWASLAEPLVLHLRPPSQALDFVPRPETLATFVQLQGAAAATDAAPVRTRGPRDWEAQGEQ